MSANANRRFQNVRDHLYEAEGLENTRKHPAKGYSAEHCQCDAKLLDAELNEPQDHYDLPTNDFRHIESPFILSRYQSEDFYPHTYVEY